MKPLKSLLAVSLSAAMLFSAPVSGITGMEPQTVEAATKSCKLKIIRYHERRIQHPPDLKQCRIRQNSLEILKHQNCHCDQRNRQRKKGWLHIHLRSIWRKDLQMQGNNQRSQNTCTQQNLADIKSGWPVQSRIKKCSRKSNMEVL